MGETEKIKEILRQLNRRLMNVEASLRMLEQRIDMNERLIKANEEKIAKNTEKIIRLDVSSFASKEDLESLKKYLELIDPLKLEED
jgi:hypothetical protein